MNEPLHPWIHRACRVLTWPMLGVVLLAALWPSGNDVIAVKEAVGPSFMDLVGKDVVLNVVFMAPLAALITWGWTRIRPWVTAVGIMALSALVETLQWALPMLHRRALVANVVENSVGAWLAIAVAVFILKLAHRSRR